MKIQEIRQKTFKKDNTYYHVLITEPLTVPVLFVLQYLPFLTPNIISLISLIITLGAAYAFLEGMYVLGAILYFLGYFADSLDGKVARLRGMSSKLGAYLDSAIDTFRPFILTIGLWPVLETLAFGTLLGLAYVTFVLAYQVTCSSAYTLNAGKQVMTQYMEVKQTGLIIKVKQLLAKYRFRLGYTSAETNAFAFLLGPLLAGIFSESRFILGGYGIAIAMMVFLTAGIFIVQTRTLSK